MCAYTRGWCKRRGEVGSGDSRVLALLKPERWVPWCVPTVLMFGRLEVRSSGSARARWQDPSEDLKGRIKSCAKETSMAFDSHAVAPLSGWLFLVVVVILGQSSEVALLSNACLAMRSGSTTEEKAVQRWNEASSDHAMPTGLWE